MLMPSRGAGDAITSQCVECLAQTSLGVEASMRHRHTAHDQRVATEAFYLEAKSRQVFTILLERVAFGGTEMQSDRKQQPLRRKISALQRAHELLVQHSLMCRVL